MPKENKKKIALSYKIKESIAKLKKIDPNEASCQEQYLKVKLDLHSYNPLQNNSVSSPEHETYANDRCVSSSDAPQELDFNQSYIN